MVLLKQLRGIQRLGCCSALLLATDVLFGQSMGLPHTAEPMLPSWPPQSYQLPAQPAVPPLGRPNANVDSTAYSATDSSHYSSLPAPVFGETATQLPLGVGSPAGYRPPAGAPPAFRNVSPHAMASSAATVTASGATVNAAGNTVTPPGRWYGGPELGRVVPAGGSMALPTAGGYSSGVTPVGCLTTDCCTASGSPCDFEGRGGRQGCATAGGCQNACGSCGTGSACPLSEGCCQSPWIDHPWTALDTLETFVGLEGSKQPPGSWRERQLWRAPACELGCSP